MFDNEISHGEVLGIPSRQPSAYGERGGGHQAIRLGEGSPPGREFASPFTGLPPFAGSQRRDPKTGKKPSGGFMLRRQETTHGLLDIDGAYVDLVA